MHDQLFQGAVVERVSAIVVVRLYFVQAVPFGQAEGLLNGFLDAARALVAVRIGSSVRRVVIVAQAIVVRTAIQIAEPIEKANQR